MGAGHRADPEKQGVNTAVGSQGCSPAWHSTVRPPLPALLAPVLSLAGTAPWVGTPRALLGFMLLGSRVKIGLGGGGGRGGANFRKDKKALSCFQTRQCLRLAPAGGAGAVPGCWMEAGMGAGGRHGVWGGTGQGQGAVSGGVQRGATFPVGAGRVRGRRSRWALEGASPGWVPGGAGSGAGCGVTPRAPARAVRGRAGAVGVSSPEVRRGRSPARPVT